MKASTKHPKGVHVLVEPPQMLVRQLKDLTRTVLVVKWKLLEHRSFVPSSRPQPAHNAQKAFFNLLNFQAV